MNFKKRLSLVTTCITIFSVQYSNSATLKQPNIVLILVDDMGYADLGCYGGTVIQTPNLDNLSQNGIRFSQFYNSARCSPTRASLLTGLYPHQAGMGYLESMNKGEEHPGYRGQLNNSCVTIAETLKSAGYFTAISGKWHVGGKYGLYPWNRGFDRSLTAIHSAFYYPQSSNAKSLHLNGKPISPFSDSLPVNWYSTDLYASYGLNFIDEALSDDKPFFLYLAFNAPHFPLQAPKEVIEKYKGKFDDGWDKMREPVYKKQIEIGLIDSLWPLSKKHPDVPDWDKLPKDLQQRMSHIQEIYAASIDCMDNAVGNLINGLKERDIFENTIIIFLSDNGACAEQGPFGRYSGKEKSGTVNSNVFQGQSWATLSNTPFRRYKHFTTEGGISTPCIIHWPAGIEPMANGKIISDYANVIDIMPTLIELADTEYPAEYNGNKILPMEGQSLKPVLNGQKLDNNRPMYWEHEGNRAARMGKWKAVSFNHEPWVLFDLENDRTEQWDVSSKHPEILSKLASGWDIWAKRCNVEPWPDKRNSAGQPQSVENGYQIKNIYK